MSKEKPELKSEGYGLHEEWEAIENLGGLIGEAWLLPEVILGDLVEDIFGL